MLILPITFLGDIVFCILWIGGPDGLCCVPCSGYGMGWNVCSCHGLTCGASSKASCTVLFSLTGSRMSCKRGPSYVSHSENPGTCPLSARFDGLSRPVVLREFFFEVR